MYVKTWLKESNTVNFHTDENTIALTVQVDEFNVKQEGRLFAILPDPNKKKVLEERDILCMISQNSSGWIARNPNGLKQDNKVTAYLPKKLIYLRKNNWSKKNGRSMRVTFHFADDVDNNTANLIMNLFLSEYHPKTKSSVVFEEDKKSA